MTGRRGDHPPPVLTRAGGGLPPLLLGAAHPLPALAVTALSGLLAAAMDLSTGRTVLVVAAVLTGQLSIGWCNDLADVSRDRAVGRTDKPLATGALPVSVTRLACAVAVLLTVALSLSCGLVAGLVHLACVAMGWAYNLGLKATIWSWLPYAFAFGGLTVFVSLARPSGDLPALWVPLAAALLGVGAHVLNVLPDLGDDAATGVRGLPHRVGPRWSPVVATTVLVLATVVIVVGAAVGVLVAAVALVLVGALATVTLLGRGRAPFLGAIGIAVVDVVMLAGAR